MRGALTWDSLAHLPVVLTAAAACCTVAVVAYRPQLRRAGLRWRWTLPAFRVAALVALLASVLRPSILRPAAPADLGAVAVVLDDSPSMSVTDASWTPAELVGLADALHALPPHAARWSPRDVDQHLARIRPLIDNAARAASEVEYARVAGRSADVPERRAAQTRAALIAACNALAARAPAEPQALRPVLSAWSEAAAVIDTRARAAWADLRARADATAAAIRAHQAESDARLYAENPAVRDACDRLAQRSRIDLARRAVERGLLPGLPPGVPVRTVLASDPDHPFPLSSTASTRPSTPDAPSGSASADPAAAALALAQSQRPNDPRVRSVLLLTDGRQPDAPPRPSVPPGGPPVIACLVAPASVKDVAVHNVDAPPIAYVGDTTDIHLDLTSHGLAGAPVTVTAECDGAVESRQAKLDPAGRASIDLPVRFTHAGPARLTVRVDPLPGEATAANNAVERHVRVLADRVETLALTGDAPPDAADALRHVLSRVPGVTARVAPAAAAPPPDDIRRARVILLADARADSLTAEQLDALRDAVTVRGGALVLLAGRSNWPLDESSEALLDDFLPYRDPGGPLWWFPFGQQPVAAPAVTDLPPGLLKLPTAGTFLQLGPLRAGVRTLVVDPDTGSPLVTEARAGSGTVLTLVTDTAVSHDPASPSADPAPFWTALIRHVAEPPYAVRKDGYALDTDRPDADAGSAVRVRVKVPPAGRISPDTRPPSLLVLSDNRVVRSESLTATGPESDGRYAAVVSNLPGGDYVIRLDTGIDDELAPLLDVPLHVRPADAADLADVSPDPASLRRLTGPTGGAVIPITDAGRLAAAVLRGRPDRPQSVEYPLWDSPYLFLFVTSCLTAEWALRKRLGLA